MSPSSVFAVLCAMAVSSPALACRYNAPPQARVARDFDGVALGVVEQAHLDEEDANEGRGWRAIVRVTETLEGQSTNTSYLIGRTGDSASCDDGQGMPEVGDEWVVYLRRHPAGSVASESYPLEMARRIDLRFR